MSRYISQPRIEDHVCLEPKDISFLRARISEARTDVQTIEDRADELGVQVSELMLQQNAKLVEFASLRNTLAPARQRAFKTLLKASPLSRNISQDYCVIFETETETATAAVNTNKDRISKLKAQISELTLQQDAKLFEIVLLRYVPTPTRRHLPKIFSRVLKLSHNSDHSRNDYIISQAEIVVQTNKFRLDELGAQISELATQKDTKLVEIALFRNVLAPVRRLPLEILSEVFELLRDAEYSQVVVVWGMTVHRNHDLVRRMFILTSVCAAWRKAAHATPRLWSKLSISIAKHLLGSDSEWIHDWITRSQGLALDLNLDFYRHESLKLHKLQIPWFQGLMPKGRQLLDHIVVHFGHKIRSLEIKGHPSFIPLVLQHSLPSLEEVSFILCKSEYESLTDHSPQKVEIFLNASKLYRFKINSDSIPGWIQAEQLTWFTDLAVVLLPQCSQLVSLDISSPCNFPHFILLPALKTLRTTHYTTHRSILCRIIAPLLENLSLNHTHCHLNSLVSDMTSFQQRSVTPLLFLELDCCSCPWLPLGIGVDPTLHLITILSLFPTVRTLSLKMNYSCNSDTLFQAMMCGTFERWEHHAQLLPSLTDLTLCGRLHLSDELESMVLSRWWPDEVESSEPVLVRHGISRLQKVTLDIPYGESIEDLGSISSLSGLVLDCKSSSSWY